MVINMETIMDYKCGNQSTNLLSLLHRVDMEAFSWSSPLQTYLYTMTILRRWVTQFSCGQSHRNILPGDVEGL
jgi:hypothetical protein